jgi:hypothetical protein
MLPAVYAKAYAKLSSWLWFNGDWNWTGTPIVMYLQNSGKQVQGRSCHTISATNRDFRPLPFPHMGIHQGGQPFTKQMSDD